MSNDFFNLNSDEDDEDREEEKRQAAAIRKWDWDREENFEVFFGTNKPDSDEKLPKKMKTENSIESKTTSKKDPSIETAKSSSSGLLFNLKGHSGAVNRIHWRKGNHTMLLSSSMDGKIITWDLSNPNSARNIRVYEDVHSKSIRNAIWSLNQTEIISISYDKSCALTDIQTGSIKNRLETDEIVTAVCAHPTNEYQVLVGSKNLIFNWDTREKDSKSVYKSPMGLVQDIVFINNDEFVSSGDVVNKESAQYSIIVWDAASRARISDQIFHEKFICTSLKRHPYRPLFYAQTHGNYIAEFDARPPFKMTKHKRFETRSHRTQGYYVGLDINSSGNLVASGGIDGRAYIYDLKTTMLVKRLDAFVAPSEPCLDVKFNENKLAASSWAGEIKILEF